jgi:phospholipase C
MNSAGACRMDGEASNTCTGTCPAHPGFQYADNSTGLLNPYLDMATEYGWANYMFQTNQGPSFPAHQFLFGGTSAPNAADDAAGTFAAENVTPASSTNTFAGCIAPATTYVWLLTTAGETQKIYPCFDHTTLSDLLDTAGVTWKYYAPGPGTIWTAPNAISHICQPNQSAGGNCVGPEWTSNVVLTPLQFLRDVTACTLADVTWVIPEGAFSDHPRSNNGDGPSWVASVVNAIGNNRKCKDGETYWNNTAILLTWDDWGGWYDHEPPKILAQPQGDYQYGFRVPFIAISAYTNAGYVDNKRYDFGSILRFIEQNYGIAEGALNFADARTTTDLTSFFNLNQAPRIFTTIPARRDVNSFINDTSPMTDPDDY